MSTIKARSRRPAGRDHAGYDAIRGDSERPEVLSEIPGAVGDSGLRNAVVGITSFGRRRRVGNQIRRGEPSAALVWQQWRR